MATPKYYFYPFASSGIVLAVPDPTQGDGSISYQQGFGPDYELTQGVDPDALPVPLNSTNQLFLDATSNIQYWQQNALPFFISTSDNDGTPYTYPAGALVQYPGTASGDPFYRSIAGSNTALPSDATHWGLWDNVAGKLTLDNAVFMSGVANANVVYFNSGSSNFQLAQANNSGAQNALGIADVTNLRLITNGQCAVVTGLTPGSIYYLSAVTAGAISTTPSAVKIGTALTATLLLVNISQNVINQSLVTPGYISLPGGFILQWGTTGNVPLSDSVTVTFPIAFPNAFLGGQATTQTAPGSALGSSEVAGITSGGTTSMIIANNSTTNATSYLWLAYGN